MIITNNEIRNITKAIEAIGAVGAAIVAIKEANDKKREKEFAQVVIEDELYIRKKRDWFRIFAV